MRPAELVRGLTGFERRGAGSDAERRAALWLASELQTPHREATTEPFWCRPNLALTHAWHALLGIAGGLVSISSPKIGGALVLVALLSVLGDSLAGHSIGRRLTREHASQNVVSDDGSPEDRVRLIITSNYDAGRVGIAYASPLRRAAAWWRRLAGHGRFTPGWVGWLAVELIWLIVVAILRDGGATGTWIGAVQLVPMVGLLLELALLLVLGGNDFGPAAGDNASGTAVTVALARALDAAPPHNLRVEVVLQGASDGQMIGLVRYLRSRRPKLTAAGTIVLGIAPCGSGTPRWWRSDGSLVPLGYLPRLRDLVASLGGPGTDLDARPDRGRGITPAFPARAAGLPAITLGALDERGLVPRSHRHTDVADAVDPGAMDTVLELALTLVDALDADLGTAGRPHANPPAGTAGAAGTRSATG